MHVRYWTPDVERLTMNSAMDDQMVSTSTYLKYFSHHWSTLESDYQMIVKYSYL